MSEGERTADAKTMNQDSKNRLVAGIAVAAVIVVVLIAALTANSEPGESDARSECEAYVDARLKAPATADYNLVASQDGEQWTVIGTVDSENGFGAKIRSDVTCELHFEGDTAYLDDLAVG